MSDPRPSLPPAPGPTRRAVMAGAAGLAAATALRPLAARAAASLSVVATTGMIADAARAVAGDVAEVATLIGPGVDPHSHRQTRADVLALTRADLVLWNGLYLEAQLEELMAELAARKPVVAVAEAVPAGLLLADADYPDRRDPHVWMVPALWTHAGAAVRDALAALLPEAAEALAARADDYAGQLMRLDAYARETLATVPERARVLVTAHDAFSYFGRAYGFEVEGVQGVSTESEAGLRRIEELVALIVDRGVRAVFVESAVSDRNVRALVEGAAARGHEVVVGGRLFADAMGAQGSYEGTYPGMVDHNVTTIARALGGIAPVAGLNGRLGGA